MQLPMLAVVAEVAVETEIVVEETEVAKAVTTPVTTAPNPPKTLMLLIALQRRRRKVSGSNLLTTKTFMTTLARCAIAPPRRTIAICVLSTDSDRILQRDALILARHPHLYRNHPVISGLIQKQFRELRDRKDKATWSSPRQARWIGPMTGCLTLIDYPDLAYVYKDYSGKRVVTLGHREIIVYTALPNSKTHSFITTGYYSPGGHRKLFSIQKPKPLNVYTLIPLR
ncbi:hypothetical protein N7505_009052 [Penicillium chrysogenum]|uniref:Uncharacterized protein n=1 Tax=Penicillium chrysogenum TaxID=5076 RepID=A0ABQ8WAG3_PENCH|nr:hypothetical protein N7505_009052 [Penicillium chrysogenum]